MTHRIKDFREILVYGDQFFLSEGSSGFLGLMQASDLWNLRALFGKTFRNFLNVGSIIYEELKSKLRRAEGTICQTIFPTFDCISSTVLEIFFFYRHTDGSGASNLSTLLQRITTTNHDIEIQNI